MNRFYSVMLLWHMPSISTDDVHVVSVQAIAPIRLRALTQPFSNITLNQLKVTFMKRYAVKPSSLFTLIFALLIIVERQANDTPPDDPITVHAPAADAQSLADTFTDDYVAEAYGVFDEDLQDYFWEYANNDLLLYQLQFHEVLTE